MNYIKRFFKLIKFKRFFRYYLVGMFFLIWISFLDINNLLTHKKLNNSINELKNAKSYYKDEIKKDSLSLYKLTEDSTYIEKFARENYFFKKKGEDVFIIEKKKR